jgi:hypothetical protein
MGNGYETMLWEHLKEESSGLVSYYAIIIIIIIIGNVWMKNEFGLLVAEG